jgi:starvation-inducible DNA-binding protein
LDYDDGQIQAFGTLAALPTALSDEARLYSCQRLNQLSADTRILHALYKNHHWVTRGPSFFKLHLLFEKHAAEQARLIDEIAERIQALGGVAVGDPRHVAEITRIPRPPDGCEALPAMLSRVLDAHELILADAQDAIARVAERGDTGTKDLIVSDVIRTGAAQVWSLAQYLAEHPVRRA